MTVWYHQSTIFNRCFALRIAGFIALCVALITTLIFAHVTHAAPGINQTLSFQARLQNASGAVVPDGYYNIQFKIYQDGAGTAAGNPGGTLKWTESYVNNGGTSGVQVKNGYMSVTLGSNNPFGSSIDWNQDTLWLSMNIAGSATGCTTFGSSPCTADGEMLPMKRLTSVPFAINSAQLEGKSASNFIQLAQGIQTDASSNTSSIYINKTGSGNLVQLQNTAADVFTISNAGDLSFGNNANHTLSIATSGASTAGKSLTVGAGAGGSGSGSNGGSLTLQGGAAGGTNANGGDVFIDGGAKTGGGNYGQINIGTNYSGAIVIGSTSLAEDQTINIGSNNTAGSETNVTIGSGGSAAAGSTTIRAKDSIDITTNGSTRATFDSSGNLDILANTTFVGGASAVQGTAIGLNQSWNGSDYVVQSTGQSSQLTSTADAGFVLKVSSGKNASETAYNDTLLTGTAAGDNLAILIDSGIQYDDNLLANPGLEFGTSGWAVYDGATASSASPRSGYKHLRYVAPQDDSAVYINNRSIAVIPGDTFEIGGYIKTNSTSSGTAGIAINWHDKDGNFITASVADSANPGTSYTFRHTLATAPANAAYAKMMAVVFGNGTVAGTWDWDDMYMKRVTDNSAKHYQGAVNSSTAFTVSDSSANKLLNVDTENHIVSIGNGDGSGPTSLFKVDRGDAAPADNDDALLGSMYYDTTIGKLQCYEADGWGACGEAPDTFVSLSPEYSGAVTNGSSLGQMTTDLCSDSLDINDATNGPEVCGTNETYNFYRWTSGETSAQTKSIYVTYKLPSSFKEFVAGSTSLLGRRDGTDANVNYQVYRNDGSGLTACGSAVSVTSSQNTWQTGTATSGADPQNCSFEAGDSIVFRINLSAQDDSNAYVSNLGFIFSNN